ncbi:MAG TPA: DUF2703 domain-containing protein [Syntrophorhabdaceae bacterium]|nr:DUF2703 domain-containing protein [Syntrophorhabdaceae bacterium]HOL05248.1 DUF2703 domain-containing protein [Syntrophorhabdaceae bacterium]HON84831.1 DUF2703 domain-containing protein [Syntrophorhabdaceae bacterium]HOT41908.1 DUF2703 domain-containing protein [Syntrophorhabdaceae bacterium]HPC66409.1 DUF2703 domain-containing protein [Syntrophorhabdaceae bacterium]
MGKIRIELFRYEKEGTTCCRCGDSTEVVRRVVEELKSSGIDIELEEIIVGEDKIDISNTIKINGRDIMDIVGEKMRILTNCPSCSDLIGRNTDCNSYIYKGKIYDSLPETMLKEAIYKEVYK